MSDVKAALPLAANIRTLRHRTGLSQAALGERVGLTRSNIASYENAKAEPRAIKLVELARFFGVSTDDLIVGDLQNLDAPVVTRGGAVKRRRADTALRQHLGTFTSRNRRVRELLAELQHASAEGSESRANVEAVAEKFERLVSVMNELVRNDEEIAQALRAVSEPAAFA